MRQQMPASEISEVQRQRSAANKAAALERRAAALAAPPAAAPPVAATPVAATSTAAATPAPAAPPVAAPLPATPSSDQATVDQLSSVASAAEQRALSDSLGVSSALYLGVSDMLKLQAMLEQPDNLAHAQRVLRRLSMVPMTSKLDETTGFVAFMAELSDQEMVQAAVQAGAEDALRATALIARIVSTWEAQLQEEQKQRDDAALKTRQRQDASAAPRQQRQKDPNCLACQGRHRPHTCK